MCSLKQYLQINIISSGLQTINKLCQYLFQMTLSLPYSSSTKFPPLFWSLSGLLFFTSSHFLLSDLVLLKLLLGFLINIQYNRFCYTLSCILCSYFALVLISSLVFPHHWPSFLPSIDPFLLLEYSLLPSVSFQPYLNPLLSLSMYHF